MRVIETICNITEKRILHVECGCGYGASQTRIVEETYMLRMYTLNPSSRSIVKAHTERNWPLMSAEWQDARFARACCKGAHGRSFETRKFQFHAAPRPLSIRVPAKRYRKTETVAFSFLVPLPRARPPWKIHSPTQKISCTHDRAAFHLENVARELSSGHRPFMRATCRSCLSVQAKLLRNGKKFDTPCIESR